MIVRRRESSVYRESRSSPGEAWELVAGGAKKESKIVSAWRSAEVRSEWKQLGSGVYSESVVVTPLQTWVEWMLAEVKYPADSEWFSPFAQIHEIFNLNDVVFVWARSSVYSKRTNSDSRMYFSQVRIPLLLFLQVRKWLPDIDFVRLESFLYA